MKITNRDILIRALIDDYLSRDENEKETFNTYIKKIENIDFDNGGATEEAEIRYHINCPYYGGDKRAECYGSNDDINEDQCYFCKYKWLEMKCDD